MKKIILLLTAFVLLYSVSFAQVYSGQQPIDAGHWIYDALYYLNLEQKKSSTMDNAPLTVSELYLNFQQINKDELSDTGKEIYEKAETFFDRKKFLFDFNGAKFTANAILNPTGAIRSNSDVDWSYASSYTDSDQGYVSTAAMGTVYTEPVLIIPFILDFGEFAYIGVEPYVGAGPFWALTSDFYAVNIPTGRNGAECGMWPMKANASIGKSFETWGAELNVGRQGLEIGRTKTGSILYNSTFQTDFFVQLNLYSPQLKYTMDVAQVDVSRFLYLHSAEVIPFSWLKLGIFEGTMVDGAFELRYLNPLIFMHAFSGWRQYTSELEKKYYDEAHFCAYFGWSFDLTPCKYLRIYGMYAQNEIQSVIELNNDYDHSVPDSFAYQLGAEALFPVSEGFLTTALEGIYTTPFCYLKPTKAASLARVRENDAESYGLGKISSWIGSPFGPDALGGEFSVEYNIPVKLKLGAAYLFMAHGTNSFGLFNKTKKIQGEEYDSFYPSAMYLQGEPASKTTAMRTYELTPVVQYTNRITLAGEYYFLSNLSAQATGAYTFIYNNKARKDEFAHGLELTLSARYSFF